MTSVPSGRIVLKPPGAPSKPSSLTSRMRCSPVVERTQSGCPSVPTFVVTRVSFEDADALRAESDAILARLGVLGVPVVPLP